MTTLVTPSKNVTVWGRDNACYTVRERRDFERDNVYYAVEERLGLGT